MSDYEEDTYDDDTFDEGSPQKAAPKRPESREASASELHSRQSSSHHSDDDGGDNRGAFNGSDASPPPPPPQHNHSSHRTSVEPTPRENLNWLKPTPKTPPREASEPPTPRKPASRGDSRGSYASSRSSHRSSPQRTPSRASSRRSTPSPRKSPASSHGSPYSSVYSSPAQSPGKTGRSSKQGNTVPVLPVAQPKPTSAPTHTARSHSSSSSDIHSNPISPSKQPSSHTSSGKPAKSGPLAGRPVLPATVQEMNLLRLKNAELQRAIDNAKQQLVKLAPRMSVLKVKKRSDEERLKKLQAEAAVLLQDFTQLSKKARDANHVKTLEKNIKEREEEIKRLSERNRFLQVEIRQNGKRLKHCETIEEQRKNLLEGLRNERIIAQMNLERAKKDAESAAKTRESLAHRIVELESKDKLRDMPLEEVKRMIELRAQIASKDESIANLEQRLAVVRRAADSSNISRNAGLGVAAMTSQPANDSTAIETLKEEIAAMKAKLELYSVQRGDDIASANAKKRQQQQPAKAAPPAAAPAAKASGAALPPIGAKAQGKKTAVNGSAPPAVKPNESAWVGVAAPSQPAANSSAAKPAARSNSADRGGVSGASQTQPPRSESVPPSIASSGSMLAEANFVPSPAASPSNRRATPEEKKASSPPAASADDTEPPWMQEEIAKETSPTQQSSVAAPRQTTSSLSSSSVQKDRASNAAVEDSGPSWLDESPPRKSSGIAAESVLTPTVGVNAGPAAASASSTPLVVFDDKPSAQGASRGSTSESASAPVASQPPAPSAAAASDVKPSDEPSWLFDE